VTGASWDLSEYLKRTKSEHWKADVSFKNRVDVPRGPDGQFGFDIESKARGNFVASITPGASCSLPHHSHVTLKKSLPVFSDIIRGRAFALHFEAFHQNVIFLPTSLETLSSSTYARQPLVCMYVCLRPGSSADLSGLPTLWDTSSSPLAHHSFVCLSVCLDLGSSAEMSGLRAGQRILTCNDVDVRISDSDQTLQKMLESSNFLALEVADGRPWGYRVLNNNVTPVKPGEAEDARLASLTQRVIELRRRTEELVDKRKKSQKKKKGERTPTPP
jgi:hypothetical protein